MPFFRHCCVITSKPGSRITPVTPIKTAYSNPRIITMKISKDNLFLFSRIIPVVFIIVHLWVIFFVITVNFWVIYVVYLFIASGHFLFAKIWRLFLLRDAYLNKHLGKVAFKNLKGKEMEFNLSQIIKLSTYFGITDVLISDNNRIIKIYFQIDSKENLEYLI